MLAIVGCTGRNDGKTKSAAQQKDTVYTKSAAMNIYGYQPIRALQIIDSAVIVGNISDVQGEQCRARIYSMSLMHEQLDSLLGGKTDVRLDSAQAICERLLSHDSIKSDLKKQKDVLEVLANTERMQNDTIGWLQRLRELVVVCRQIGAEAKIDALRTEAEIGAALHAVGQHEEGMSKLDSVIEQLQAYPSPYGSMDIPHSETFTFDKLDALIIALKRKSFMLATHEKYAETVPIAHRIIECLDDYEAHPNAYHDGSSREPKTDEKREDYINFYRKQAQNLITAAYTSLGENRNMIESFKQLESSVRNSTAREHITRYQALEHQMQRQAAESHSRQMTLIAIATSTGLFIVLVFAFFIYRKNRIINKKNRGLAKLIDENIKLKEQPQAAPMKKESGSPLFTRLATEIREQELYLNPSFDRQAVCDYFHVTAVQVGNAFAQGSDYDSVADFIRDCRLEHARQLLKTTDLKIAEIATRSGFSRVTTFNHDFKTHYNLSPTEYRQQ